MLIPKKDIYTFKFIDNNISRLISGYTIPEQHFRISPYDSNICATQQSFGDEYSSKLTVPNMQNVKTVYFDKLTKFPRSKMSAYSTLKRVINPDKADIYVVPDKLSNLYVSWVYLVKVLYQNKPAFFVITDFGLRNVNFPNCSIYEPNNIALDKILLVLKHFEIIQHYEIVKRGVYNISSSTYELLNTMLTKPYTFVSESNFSKFINSNTSVLTKDNFDFLLNLVQSSDEGSHRLALETLCNFNVLETPASIALLVEKCPNKRFSSASIKQLFNDLESITHVDFSRDTLRNSEVSYRLRGALHLRKKKDIEILKDYFTEALRKHLKNVQSAFFNGCEEIFNINLVKDAE